MAMLAVYLLLAVIRPGQLGMGDVKFGGVIGLFLGWLGLGRGAARHACGLRAERRGRAGDDVVLQDGEEAHAPVRSVHGRRGCGRRGNGVELPGDLMINKIFIILITVIVSATLLIGLTTWRQVDPRVTNRQDSARTNPNQTRTQKSGADMSKIFDVRNIASGTRMVETADTLLLQGLSDLLRSRAAIDAEDFETLGDLLVNLREVTTLLSLVLDPLAEMPAINLAWLGTGRHRQDAQ